LTNFLYSSGNKMVLFVAVFWCICHVAWTNCCVYVVRQLLLHPLLTWQDIYLCFLVAWRVYV